MEDVSPPEVDHMRQSAKSLSLVILLLLSAFSSMLVVTDEAEANTVVITEAVQVVNGGAASDQQAAVGSDSEGNVHLVWTRNGQHLWYAMLSPRGETLIDATQVTNSGLHKIAHPDLVVDEDDTVHVVWADRAGQHSIMYTALQPFKAPRDGQATTDGTITGIDDTILSKRAQNRDWPAIDVDSQGSLHVVWQDSYDPLDKFFAQPQIYYTMFEPDVTTQSVLTLFDDSLLTPIIGHKGHPDVVVDANDYVQIAWDDTRGGKVELVFVVDTSGSMYSEWADVCTVIYGGNFASGGYFRGIKPMLADANMTVYETIYGLGNTLPSVAQSGNCAAYYKSGQGPRSTALGQYPGDDSGGLRVLPETIYNGNTYSGYSGEDWGPGTNWACLSWKDASGNVPGNPASTSDHKWNPNATKIAIPISDEGPKDGDPASGADDTASIEEAHDSCVRAGVVPVGLYGQTYGGAGTVESHFRDLAQCPNGVVSQQTRNCPGSTIRNTDAGGQVYEFPSGTSNNMGLLVEAMVYISTNNSREIYMTVLDPYGKMQNDPTWTPGDMATTTSGNSYVEDTGSSADGHIVVVNDTRITIDDAYSFHPSIGVDLQGNTHIAWMDGRDYGFEKEVNYETYYTKLRLQGAGAWDGAEEGLSTYAIKKIDDTPISNVEGNSGLQQGRPYGGNSVFPSLLTDDQNNVHIAWIDSGNASAGEEVVYTRLNATDLTGPGETALDPWEIAEVTKWNSNKLGPDNGRQPDIGMPPAFSNDLGSGAHIAWSDTNKCSDEANNNRFTICYSHVLTGQVDVELDVGETYYHVIEPGEQTVYNLTVNNSTPGPTDLVADAYTLNVSGVPQNWTATLYFANNHTTIFPDTVIPLAGGEMARFYMRVKAPSIYQANEDEFASIVVTSKSTSDPAIQSQLITLTKMDVVHGINLETSHSIADIEQGQTAIFSITITNTGNVFDRFDFWDPATLEGQAEWVLPFAWQVNFPTSVELDPGQSVTKNLEVSVPTTEDPGLFVIYLKGWSAGEPVKSVQQGTYDILELQVFVSIRSTGNIVFEIFDTSEYVLPGECATYPIDVTKNFDSGSLVFTTPGAPEERPQGVDIAAWRVDHWTVDVDFSDAPGGNSVDLNEPRDWVILGGDESVTHEVRVEVCAPTNATAGLGPAVTLKANLESYPRISDSVLLSTNVIHVYDLEAGVDPEVGTALYVNPGEERLLPITVRNEGNGPDRYDFRLARVTDSSGVDVLWGIDVPRDALQELDRDAYQTFEVRLNVPDMVEAGAYTIVFEAYSEEAYPDDSGRETRLRDTLVFTVNVNEFHDMRISMDSAVDNPVKTSAPGRVVTFEVNITNFGNVPDTPSLHNYTTSGSGDDIVWNTLPGMGSLASWKVTWMQVERLGSDVYTTVACDEMLSTASAFPEDRCVHLTDINTWRMPEMDAYTTIGMVAEVHIGTDAALITREVGLKVASMYGDAEAGGDHDDSPEWYGEFLDSNEQIVTLRLRAPNLRIVEVGAEETQAKVGESIPVRVVLANDGNTHATDIEIILCAQRKASESVKEELRQDGCNDDDIVMRQVVGAILAPTDAETEKSVEVYLLYPVTAGSKAVYVMLDPNNEIVEQSERDNIAFLTDELQSNSPFVDQTAEVVSAAALPGAVVLLTLALLGVLFLVGAARRGAVKARIAEQSSLMSVLNSDED